MQPDPAQLFFRDYLPDDRAWVTAANLHHYTEVEGFDAGFAQAVSDALDLLEAKRKEPTSSFLIVGTGQDPRPVGCVFFSSEPPATGRLRLFYLDRRYRGLGLGRRMIETVIAHAQAQGIGTIRVSTFDRHRAACGLYRAMGFDERARTPVAAFGQTRHQIDFEKTLPAPSRSKNGDTP